MRASNEEKYGDSYNVLLRNVGVVADAIRQKNTRRSDENAAIGGHVNTRNDENDGIESLDFEEMESIMWRKHHLRRFFQDRGHWWTASRRTTTWKWVLVILTGFLIACMGALVQVLTEKLTSAKFSCVQRYMSTAEHGLAFLTFSSMCLLYAFLAGLLCWYEPAAAGSGIPEIKAYLNGVNLNNVVSLRVLYSKVLGMCLSVAAGLPLGKEGPMIHAGSIIGAAVSQGKTLTFGFDTSWTKFQDLRSDNSKRDFVTFGAAAGIAAAFKAPIGGILFTLEEGASYWSTALTFRAFFCALVTELTFTIIFNGFTITPTSNEGEFAFGSFENFTGYRTYELFIFALMGVTGGLMGASFNIINKKMTIIRQTYYDTPVKRFADLLGITFGFSVICFVLPLAWEKCTPIPVATEDWTDQERTLLADLVQFNCPSGKYNQLASLFFTGADTAMQQLYHFREINGSKFATFDIGCLILFFIPYFLMAAITSGTLAPAGLFVPTLLSGAAFGRIVGRILNLAIPGYVVDSGSYALIGAAAILGGMSRSTIAATVIVLEACGNNGYLLPLMITFAAARYTGNCINQSIYDMQIHLKKMPFLEGALRSYGLLNYHPTSEIMARPVVTMQELNVVKDVYKILATTTHNGFPVVNNEGHLRGFILRKTLCSLLKLRAFSAPSGGSLMAGASTVTVGIGGGGGGGGVAPSGLLRADDDTPPDVASVANPAIGITGTDVLAKEGPASEGFRPGDKDAPSSSSSLSSSVSDIDSSSRGLVSLTPAASMFLETLERHYPNYPTIDEVDLSPTEMGHWLDIRPYMDSAPYSINESSSVKRCYRIFRTMGLRHLTVVDGDHRVTGIVTRKDITEARLDEHWINEGESMQKLVNLDNDLSPAVLSEFNGGSGGTDGVGGGGISSSGFTTGFDGYVESSAYGPTGTGGKVPKFLQRYLGPHVNSMGLSSRAGPSQSSSSSPNLSSPLLSRNPVNSSGSNAVDPRAMSSVPQSIPLLPSVTTSGSDSLQMRGRSALGNDQKAVNVVSDAENASKHRSTHVQDASSAEYMAGPVNPSIVSSPTSGSSQSLGRASSKPRGHSREPKSFKSSI